MMTEVVIDLRKELRRERMKERARVVRLFGLFFISISALSLASNLLGVMMMHYLLIAFFSIFGLTFIAMSYAIKKEDR